MKIVMINVADTGEHILTDGQLEAEVGEYILNDLDGRDEWLLVTEVDEASGTAQVRIECPPEEE